jgi:hypothetical protein
LKAQIFQIKKLICNDYIYINNILIKTKNKVNTNIIIIKHTKIIHVNKKIRVKLFYFIIFYQFQKIHLFY